MKKGLDKNKVLNPICKTDNRGRRIYHCPNCGCYVGFGTYVEDVIRDSVCKECGQLLETEDYDLEEMENNDA